MREQIADQARSGALPVGYRLPTVRGLADDLGLAANTVAKAYRALEADGVIETGAGAARSWRPRATPPPAKRPPRASVYAQRARRLGLDRAAAETAVREALRAAYEA